MQYYSFAGLKCSFVSLKQEICDGYVTCTSGSDQLGLAARTVALCREGCDSNRIRRLGLQLCDDHFL